MIGEIVNTKTISTGLVALLMIIMALAPGAMNVTELNDEIDTEYGHPQDANGTATMGGILDWDEELEDEVADWTCEGGLALVTETNWDDFVTSTDNDPHNYTSWGMELTSAGSYYAYNVPAGSWVVTAGLTCMDNDSNMREAGGQFGSTDSDIEPVLVTIEDGEHIGDVSFTLMEWNEYDEPMFICGDGTEIPFEWVNDGEEDCDDGADEQQYHDSDICWNTLNGQEYIMTSPENTTNECESFTIHPVFDVDGEYSHGDCVNDFTGVTSDWMEEDCEAKWFEAGDKLNWFDCYDGTQVWINQVNDGTDDCPEGDDEMPGDDFDDCPFMDGPGSPCEPVATNPCYADHDSDECGEYVMEYCASNTDDSGCDDIFTGPTFRCGDGSEIPFAWVNDGEEDCEDGADEQQYNAADEEINWFDCYDGSQVWIHQVNDGTDDCPDGDDEMPDDDGGDCPFMDGPGSPCDPVATNPCYTDDESPECYDYVMEYCESNMDDPGCGDMGGDDNGEMSCDEVFIEFHLVTSELGGVHFVFDMVCELSIEQSDEYREMVDSFVGNGDGFVTIDEVEDFMTLMTSCHDDDGTLVECDDSCYTVDEAGVETETDCDDNADGVWFINDVVMEMHESGMEYDIDSIMSGGSIVMINGMTSQHVDLVDGEDEVTVQFEKLEGDEDVLDGGPECFEVQVLPSGDWAPISVQVEPATEWELSDIESGGHAFYGCSTPDSFTAVFEYTGDGHPNGVENLPPICEFKWFMANDTAFEEGHLVTEGPDGDVEIELGAGSYMISVWCKDAEMDLIQVKWEAPELNLTNEYEGDGEVNGWVMFIIPPGLSEEIVVPYKWISEEWEGNGEFHITLDSGEGDGGDVEGDGGGLPGFTSLMTITALLGAVFFLGRRESE